MVLKSLVKYVEKLSIIIPKPNKSMYRATMDKTIPKAIMHGAKKVLYLRWNEHHLGAYFGTLMAQF